MSVVCEVITCTYYLEHEWLPRIAKGTGAFRFLRASLAGPDGGVSAALKGNR